MEIKRLIEFRLRSALLMAAEILSSWSPRTASRATTRSGKMTLTPLRSTRSRSAEFKRIIAMDSLTLRSWNKDNKFEWLKKIWEVIGLINESLTVIWLDLQRS